MSPRRRLRFVQRVALLSGLLLGVGGGCGGTRAPALPSSDGTEQALLPARVRRLTNAELERAVAVVLQEPVELQQRLAPDVRQAGYTPNAESSVSASSATRWSALVSELTEAAVVRRLPKLLGCERMTCRDRFITQAARRAFRRQPTRDEQGELERLFDRGQRASGSAAGVTLVLSALLEAPSFLYLTELGDGAATGSVTELSTQEIASFLAFTLSGGPPDEALLVAAERGELREPEARRQHARRLLGKSENRHHFRRFVLEWLEIDQLENTAKDPEQHPNYDSLKTHMLAETAAYVDEVMVHHGASVEALLAGGFASVDPSMARHYGLASFGPVVPLRGTGRVGVLQQASFLSAHAHPNTTSPVRRGDFVLRRVLCKELPRPAELGIEVVMPAPVVGQSTRERFVQHTADPSCRSCHQTIDPLGFTFERFDAAGAVRALDGERPIDSRGRVPLFGATVDFPDSEALSRWLAQEPRVRECFARQAFRYFSAQAEPKVEAEFLTVFRELPDELSGSLIELLVAYSGTDHFIQRRRTPGPSHGKATSPEQESRGLN